jgi:hypothetical protein
MAPDSEEFGAFIIDVAKAGVTEDQLTEQRVSFAYGNAPVGSSSNKEAVREDSKHNKLIPA